MDLQFDNIIERLKEIHKEFPDLRFGQILQNALDIKRMSRNSDFTDVSSKQIATALSEFKDKTKIQRNIKKLRGGKHGKR